SFIRCSPVSHSALESGATATNKKHQQGTSQSDYAQTETSRKKQQSLPEKAP
ncbi:unnamed protein product, partial [Lampetra fluviatilis]